MFRQLIFLLMLAVPGHAEAEVPVVVTDIVPTYSLAAMVMGDLGEPTLLVERGAEPHDYQLRPSQAGQIADATVVIWVGPEMTHWLADVMTGKDPASSLQLLALPGTRTMPLSAPDGSTDTAGALNPHAWLDPGNAAAWLDAIAERLSALDPAHAATYEANAATARERIATLDVTMAAELSPARGVPLVFAHDAFGYFAAHFHLNTLGVIASSDDVSPGARHLSDLRERLTPGTCIFPEALQDPKFVTGLAEGTGARIGDALDPEGLTAAPGPDGYLQIMQAAAQGIVACARAR